MISLIRPSEILESRIFLNIPKDASFSLKEKNFLWERKKKKKLEHVLK
jgi:hypothetical protein